MPLALSVTDNGDGTGGVATISGSAGGSANIVYYSLFTGDMGSIAWTSGGSRTADGTVALALAKGNYLFQLTSDGAIGPGGHQSFTDSADAIHKRVLDAVKTRIASTGVLASAKILVKWWPRATDPDFANLPLIFVAPLGSERFVGQLNTTDDVIYPALVAYIAVQNQDSVANLNTVTMFREKVSKALIKQRLAGIQEVWDCDIDADTFFDADKFLKNFMVSQMAFGFKARRTRGI